MVFVKNRSRRIWYLLPQEGSSALRISAVDGPGLNGSILVPPNGSVGLVFRFKDNQDAYGARLAFQDDDGRAEVSLDLRCDLSPEAANPDTNCRLVSRPDKAYLEQDTLAGDGTEEGVVLIRGDAYK